MKNIFKTVQAIVLFIFILFGTNTEAQVTCSGGTTNIPRSGSVTVNGVTINTSYTGDVLQYPWEYSSCTGSVTTSANSLYVGQSNPWSITLNFNKPVNDLVIVLTATGTQGLPPNENFVFNSNGGAVSITAGTNCYSTISGNTIYSGSNGAIDSGGGGGLFKITAPSAYTRLTINGNGGLDGSLMAICGLSIKPACTAGTTAPSVGSLNYSCPETSVNLATAHTGTIPSGATLVWYTNNAHTGTPLTAVQIANAGAGTYYAFYYDSVNNCYSPASSAVVVSGISCDASCNAVVDDFNAIQSIVPINTSVANDYSVVTGAGILGGERDVALINKTGTLPHNFDIELGYGYIDYAQGSGQKSTLVLQWDGIDNDASTLNPIGLGGVSFNNVKSLDFHLTKDLTNTGLPITVELYTNAGNASSLTKIFNTGDNFDVSFKFSEFTTLLGSGVDLNNIGAVVLKIDPSLASGSGLDLQLNNFNFGCCPAIPTLSPAIQPNCSTPTTGSFTITNYDSANIYTFSPSAGVVNTAGSVTAPVGTYTVTATSGGCTSSASASVIITAMSVTDTDGDGIPDACDLDDDNDGIKDIDENCSGFLAQNTSGAWKGKTASNLTATLTGAVPQPNSNSFSDGQIRYYVNQNGGGQRYYKAGSVSFTYTFSTPVPANEIAFWVDDIDPSNGATNATVSFKINGGDPNGNFIAIDYGQNPLTYLNYNTITGVMSSPSSGLDDQRLIIKGVGNTLVSTITITNSGIGSDGVAYALFANNQCDIDGDSIANIYDLDTDGDGCVDAIEGAGNFTSSQLTTASGTLNAQVPNQNFGVSVDANGIPTIVGTTGQGIGESQDFTKNDCIDSDGDGVADWQDLDDDNDGILDTDECTTINTFANYASATITGGATANATVSNIDFGNVTGTLTRVNTGVTVELGITKSTRDFSNATIYNPVGTATQAVLLERLATFNNTTNYTTYTLTLSKPVESITLHIVNFDNMRTRFTGNHREQLTSGGTELRYDAATRLLYDIDPTTVSSVTRDGYGSVKITSTDGSPITQIIFEKFDDPVNTPINDQYYYTFSLIPMCDTDGDGIPNRLDLDSDNDGCLDALEGGQNIISSQLVNSGGTVTVGTGSTASNQNLCAGTTCVDANGVPTVVGASGQGIGESQDFTKNDCIDSDGDGVADWQDLDDDNDGILDTVENCIDNTILTLDRNNISGVSTFSIVGGDNNVTPITAGYTYWVGQGSQDESIQYTFTNPVYSIQLPQVINISGISTTDSELLEVYINGTLYPITPSLISGLNASSFITPGGAIGNTTISDVINFNSININYPAGINSIRIRNNPNGSSGNRNGWEMNGLKILSRSTCNADVDGDGILNSLDLDSDNDGCPDAIEGGANFTASDLINSSMPGGNSGATSGTYNQPVIQNLGNTVGNTATTMGVPTIANTGQTVGDSQNFAANSQCTAPFCYKPAVTSGTVLDTKHGISALGRAGTDNGNWPMVRKGAWTALEAKTKGFVVNRIPKTTDVEAIANPVEGMMIYDEEADCLKIYTTTDGTNFSWKCFNTPACPD